MMDLILYQNFPINDYANQFYIGHSKEDLERRDKLFDNFKHKTFSDLSSCDKTKQRIRLDMGYYHGNMYNYGCIIERNKKGEEIKRYYIFVDVVEWLSNNTVVLHYTYDYFQTYVGSIKFKKSYVEREHVSDDTFGTHLIDEGLPITEYKALGGDYYKTYFQDFKIAVSVSDTEIIAPYDDLGGAQWDNPVPSLININRAEKSCAVAIIDNDEYVRHFINAMVAQNNIESINGVYMIPSQASEYTTICAIDCDRKIKINGQAMDFIHGIKMLNNRPNAEPIIESKTIQRAPTISGYRPKNNKCFCFPYNFVNVTNSLGNSFQLHFELSNNKNQISCEILIPLIEGGAMTCYAKNYDGVEKNLDNSVGSSQYPELPYITNTYSAYLSANQNSLANQQNELDRNLIYDIASSTIGGLLQGGAGDPAGAFIDTTMKLAGTGLNYYNQRERIDASLKDVESKGNISHGNFNPSKTLLAEQFGFKLQTMQVSYDCIKTIDDYFTMFGYKINQIKVPSLMSRVYWNYVKTSGVNLIGDVPQDALTVIKQMFDNGTTLWHTMDNMYDYDKDNSIR